MDLFDFEKKDKKLYRSSILTAIIMLIIVTIILLLGSCKTQKNIPVYNHQAIDEAYLKYDYKCDKFEDWKVSRVCDKIDTFNIEIEWIPLRDIYKNGHFYKTVFNQVTYIPVTLKQLNKTKINRFGNEVNVLSNRDREKFVQQK